MDVLTPFEGHWELSRRIEDHRAGETLEFAGEAVLRRDGAGLVYDESGRWTRAGWGGLVATRRFLWRAAGDDAIDMLYDDGRFFHRFAVGGAGAEAAHDCAPDRYEVRYAFALPSEWQAEWRVRGPAKDYLSKTTYRRAR